jgi:surface protein
VDECEPLVDGPPSSWRLKGGIHDCSFQTAITACLATHAVDGLCSSSVYGSMPGWDTSAVTSMANAFRSKSTFNADISAWNTSSVTTMHRMFEGAAAFNQAIGDWITAAVTDMSRMFFQTQAFHQPLADWNTASVTDMQYMFYNTPFDQPIGGWNTASVTTMNRMFHYAAAFAQDITGWSTPALTDSGAMFNVATAWLAKYELIDSCSGDSGRALLTRPLFSSTFYTLSEILWLKVKLSVTLKTARVVTGAGAKARCLLIIHAEASLAELKS